MNQHILLGMSGGTDSSVAAMLLLERGYNVTGVTFQFWGEDDDNVKEAADLAQQLGIKHVVYDARKIFEEKIVSYFIHEYLQGSTPFPCAKCNNEVKWNLLFEMADKLGCDKVATGHYVSITNENGIFFITEGADRDKDQSFFLWGVQQHQLERIIFPLGMLSKKEVREYAAKRGFTRVAEKKDSLGVCFCPGDYRSFLKSNVVDYDNCIYPGNFIDEEGQILGRHEGYPLYTVGQRRGLIYLNRAVFVKEIRPAVNEVVLAPLKSLYKDEFYVHNYNVVDKNLFSGRSDIHVRIRYRKQDNVCRVIFLDDTNLKVLLEEPLESIAPGQTAVFYRNGKVLGGGFIK